jgi:hypothetical protein
MKSKQTMNQNIRPVGSSDLQYLNLDKYGYISYMLEMFWGPETRQDKAEDREPQKQPKHKSINVLGHQLHYLLTLVKPKIMIIACA